MPQECGKPHRLKTANKKEFQGKTIIRSWNKTENADSLENLAQLLTFTNKQQKNREYSQSSKKVQKTRGTNEKRAEENNWETDWHCWPNNSTEIH